MKICRPLATQGGGVYHEGGDDFPDTEDAAYKTLRPWGEKVAEKGVLAAFSLSGCGASAPCQATASRGRRPLWSQA